MSKEKITESEIHPSHKFIYDLGWDKYKCACGAWYSSSGIHSEWTGFGNNPDPTKECNIVRH